ncbi:MAG: FadR family transcriptional regulator, partial [Mycolicibacterium sp.]|nr:FadR family transcriptional regulator [Mycolicibacterium sp.]
DRRGDEADAIARSHLTIDLEHIAAAMRRAGVRTA